MKFIMIDSGVAELEVCCCLLFRDLLEVEQDSTCA